VAGTTRFRAGNRARPQRVAGARSNDPFCAGIPGTTAGPGLTDNTDQAL